MSPLARRTERSRPGRRDAARDRLLAALEHELERGASLAAIRVDDLVSQAGISRATFYIHFHDKVELLEDWLLDTRRTLFDVSNAWYAAAPDMRRDELTKRIRAIFDAYRSTLTLMSAVHETALYDATVRTEFAEAFELHFAALTEHIETGQRDGTIRSGLLARETAEWLVCLLERIPVRVRKHATATELERHVEAMTAVIWSTLYAAAD